MNGKLISLPLHPDVVKNALGKHAHFVEQLVKYMTSRDGEVAIAQVTTMWASFMTAQVVHEVISEVDLQEPRERALKIMGVLFDAPRLELYTNSSCTVFNFSVLSDVNLVDALIAICDIRASYRSCVKAFEDPMDKAGYPWARTALKGLRELLAQAS